MQEQIASDLGNAILAVGALLLFDLALLVALALLARYGIKRGWWR